MNFRFASKRIVTYPVRIPMLAEDGSGATNEVTIKVRYKLLKRSEMRQLLREAAEAPAGNNPLLDVLDEERSQVNEALLLEHVVGWDEVYDEEGENQIPFSTEALQAMFEIPVVATAIETGLWLASRDAPVKNS